MEPRCLSTDLWKGAVGVLANHLYSAKFARPLPAGDASPAALAAVVAEVEAVFETEARAAACPPCARPASTLCPPSVSALCPP